MNDALAMKIFKNMMNAWPSCANSDGDTVCFYCDALGDGNHRQSCDWVRGRKVLGMPKWGTVMEGL